MQLFAFVIALVVACVLAKEKTVVSEKDNALNCKLNRIPFVGLSPLFWLESLVCIHRAERVSGASTCKLWLTKPTPLLSL